MRIKGLSILLLLTLMTPGWASCSRGEYDEGGGCTPCPLGHYCYPTQYDGSKKSECPASTYADETGLVECKPCRPGRWNGGGVQTSEISCTSCHAGTFRSTQSSCRPCNSGSFSEEEASACTLCPRGRFQRNEGKGACEPCPLGKFQPDVGRDGCGDCTDLLVASRTGSIACEPCSAGRFYKSASECSNCPPGRYLGADDIQNFGGMECKACPGGYSCPNFGTAVPQNCSSEVTTHYCPPGTTQPAPIPTGHYASELGTRLFDRVPGYATATLCDVGSYCQEGKMLPCPVGRYQPFQGSSDCIDCRANFFQDQEGQSSCKVCLQETAGPGRALCAPAIIDAEAVGGGETDGFDAGDLFVLRFSNPIEGASISSTMDDVAVKSVIRFASVNPDVPSEIEWDIGVGELEGTLTDDRKTLTIRVKSLPILSDLFRYAIGYGGWLHVALKPSAELRRFQHSGPKVARANEFFVESPESVPLQAIVSVLQFFLFFPMG